MSKKGLLMGKKLEGQTILVTGAGRGLGASFCHIVAAAGAQVLALGRQEAALTPLISSLSGAGHDIVIADVTDPVAVSAGLADKSYNGVINNAGIVTTAPLHNSAMNDARHVINTNLLGNLWVLQASVPALVAAGGGVIVNIASVLGHRPLPQTGIYAASKAAVIQMTRSAALELARENIRVNALAPGYIMTDLNREFLQSEGGARLVKKVPMRRFATIEELSAALIFLLDPQNSYMTGETLTIDGGMAAGL
jgi:NAD(P)-dependent dehydrogenase (short-subunit alcohol dehydrogenase family)